MAVSVNQSVSGGGVGGGPVQTVGSGNVSTQDSTVLGTGSVDVGNTNTLNLTLAADSSSEVGIAKVNQVQYFGIGNLTGAAHIVGSFNYSYVDATGKTIALAIGSENSIGQNNGTITRANSSLNTINGNAAGKTITLWTGATSVPTNNAGTLTRAQGFRSELTSGNTGTITLWEGFYNADASTGVGTVTSRFAFVNDDAGAVFKSKAPFCDSSFTALSPTNGGTTNIPAGVGLVVLNSGGNIAGCTLAFAAAAGFTDGQKITFYSVFAITTPAYTSAGVTQLSFPSTIAAGSFFTVQYAASGPYWIRVG